MPRPLKRQHAVEWGNPYTDPPDGMERRQLYVEVPYEDSSTPPAILHKLEELGGLGSGWSHCVGFVEPPRRELPLESKQSIRRKRLKARLEKKYPLFADLFYAEALREKPEYYGAAAAATETPASHDVPSRPPKENSPPMSAKEEVPAAGPAARERTPDGRDGAQPMLF